MGESNYFVDDYTHQDPAIFYTQINTPGTGFDSELLDTSLCVKCNCDNICGSACECVRFSGQEVNYINNLLNNNKTSSSALILECNELCKCSLTCGNRLVQFGPRKNLSVFKTQRKGCGLKTEVFINCGSFICEYAGELIGKKEARRRAQNDSVNYIFVLKEHCSGSVTETIVDPTCVGNIGRYINHCCKPNSAIIPVRVDSPVPKLAVFAVSDIQPGEEITYNYSIGGDGTGTTPCFCGAKECHGFLPFEKDLLS